MVGLDLLMLKDEFTAVLAKLFCTNLGESNSLSILPIPDSEKLVESRTLTGGYDKNLPLIFLPLWLVKILCLSVSIFYILLFRLALGFIDDDRLLALSSSSYYYC